MRRQTAVLVLLMGCVHEFAWQAWPPEQQGDVRAVTQWPLTAVLCLCVAVLARCRAVAAACAAVAVMSSTTALCSLAWLVAPWQTVIGEEQCSKRWGLPMLLLSVLAAALAAHKITEGDRNG